MFLSLTLTIILKGATKSYRKIIFVSAIKLGENKTNILKLLFELNSQLAHQIKHLHVGN